MRIIPPFPIPFGAGVSICNVGTIEGAGVVFCAAGALVGGSTIPSVQQRSRHANVRSAKKRLLQTRTQPRPGCVSQNLTHPGGDGLPSVGHSMAHRSGKAGAGRPSGQASFGTTGADVGSGPRLIIGDDVGISVSIVLGFCVGVVVILPMGACVGLRIGTCAGVRLGESVGAFLTGALVVGLGFAGLLVGALVAGTFVGDLVMGSGFVTVGALVGDLENGD